MSAAAEQGDARTLALLWGACAVLAIAGAGVVGRAGDGFAARLLAAAPRCPLHALTGIACPACGALRGALALARGDLAGALRWNPLATLAELLFVAGGIAAGFAALLGARLREPSYRLAPAARAALVAALLLNWAYLLASGV